MAQCPQCADSVLVHTMLTENLAGYSCGRCLGTLVSLVAYRAWRESPAGRDARRDTATAVADVDAPDSTAAKKCPKCRSLKSKYRVSADKANRLDYCPHCEEIWLDNGEWRLVESLVTRGEFAKVFTQAWQHDVNAGVANAMQEQRLRELLGDHYERVVTFDAWLQEQPARSEILAYLSLRRR
jgi:Zn-finger nucleic acid-binding protein